MIWAFIPILLILVGLLALRLWRSNDNRADSLAWQELVKYQNTNNEIFDWSIVSSLPEPAQRYFRFTIAPKTPLLTVVELEMIGKIGLGSKQQPKYQTMQANQIIAPPYGLVWKLKSGIISGSDGLLPNSSWTRFWLFNLLPIVRVGGTDHHRSAFGRVVSEAAFWSPASLLPGKHISWEEIGQDIARVTISHGNFSQAVDITVSKLGAPTKVVIQRWSNENTSKIYKEQPFGGFLSEYKTFNGYTLPTNVEGGNLIDTPEYFPFYKASVTSVTYPENDTNLDMSR